MNEYLYLRTDRDLHNNNLKISWPAESGSGAMCAQRAPPRPPLMSHDPPCRYGCACQRAMLPPLLGARDPAVLRRMLEHARPAQRPSHRVLLREVKETVWQVSVRRSVAGSACTCETEGGGGRVEC